MQATDARQSRRAAREMAFYRSLPPTPEAYRSDKVLADLMLGEHAFGYVGGAGRAPAAARGPRSG